MTTYRTGNHWGVTIVREQPIDGMTAVDAQLVAVVVNGDQALAERICALLNEGSALAAILDRWEGRTGEAYDIRQLTEDLRAIAPPRPLSASVSDLSPPLVGRVGIADPNAAEGECDCGHEGLPAEWHSRPCPLARVRVAGRLVPPSVGPGCICNDPPPTVDKPKNGTASRPSGWACPRHGAVI